jgi:hypothetical protein
MSVRATPWATMISWFVWRRTSAVSCDSGNPAGNARSDRNKYGVPGIPRASSGVGAPAGHTFARWPPPSWNVGARIWAGFSFLTVAPRSRVPWTWATGRHARVRVGLRPSLWRYSQRLRQRATGEIRPANFPLTNHFAPFMLLCRRHMMAALRTDVLPPLANGLTWSIVKLVQSSLTPHPGYEHRLVSSECQINRRCSGENVLRSSFFSNSPPNKLRRS